MKENSQLKNILTTLALDRKSSIILDSLPVGVEIYSPDGTLIYMSKTDARIFSVDRDVIMAAKINVFDNPNLPDDVKEAVRNRIEVQSRFPYNFDRVSENRYYDTNSRRTIYVECNGRPIVAEDGSIENYVFIVEDVTEAVRKEEELNNSKHKTELAIRDSNIMIWEFDVIRKEFYSDNDPLNDYDKSKPISIEIYTGTVHKDEHELVSGFISRMSTGDDFSFSVDARIIFPNTPEWQYCTINGSPYERDANGRVIRYVGTRRNNTDLQKKELLQDKILNSIPLPILIKDVDDNFRYVFCNDESKRMFGTDEGKTTYEVMTDENVARVKKTDKEVFATGEPYMGLERIMLKDGRSYDTIVRKSIIYDGGRRLLLNIRWDQSLQNDLERRAKLLSISMETMNAYSWFFEPDTEDINFGEGFERAGRNTVNLNTLGKFVAVIHPEDQQLFTDTISATIANKNPKWDVEYRVDLNGSGTYEWWHTQGLLETTLRDDVPYRYMYGMSINIDSHKQIEFTLRCNKEELDNLVRQNELVLNNTNSGLAYITTDYVVQWENISLCSASLSYEAYKKGELCYKSAHCRTTPCDHCVMQQAIKSKQLEQAKFILNKNHIVEVFATPVIKDGEVKGIVIRVDDVTEREQMIEELRHARALAEQSDKLKSKFLANMSHEIRTPLNAIIGFSELLINNPDIEEGDKAEYMSIISNNNELLLKLINDILDLSKIEAGSVELKYEEFDFAVYFNAMAASMKQRITNPDVHLAAINPHTSCSVLLDKNRTAQIFTNYVTNAIKYTAKGLIEMGYETSADGIKFYVKDSGIGIPDEKKNKVFHRFEKLDEFAQGTGLGLSICKAIAESMGGNVGFESKFGEGSVFWAFIPCKPIINDDDKEFIEYEYIEQPKLRCDNVAEKGNIPKKYKILIAEDIPSNYLLVSSFLLDEYELIHATNGKEAVELTMSCNPDIILMDMKMPEMDGMQATAQIRKLGNNIPIVAFTAHAFEADRKAALAIGCNDYLIKPASKKQIISVLQTFCGSSCVSDKIPK